MKSKFLFISLASVLSLSSANAQHYTDIDVMERTGQHSGEMFELNTQLELKNLLRIENVWDKVHALYPQASLIDANLLIDGAPAYELSLWDGKEFRLLTVNAESGKIQQHTDTPGEMGALPNVDLPRAIKSAESHTQGKAVMAMFDMEHGGVYMVEAIKDNQSFHLTVSAETAKILTVETATLSTDEARSVSLLPSLTSSLGKASSVLQGRVLSAHTYMNDEENLNGQTLVEIELWNDKNDDVVTV